MVYRRRIIETLRRVSYCSRFRNALEMSSACIVVIGDEVLNGKIVDTNSKFFAKYCYELGIPLKEMVTIGDDEEQIVDTLRRVREKYDFIVTSGGIGPTHDDITYESVAKSFGLPTELNMECQTRMRKLSNPEKRHSGQALKDHYRMATLPVGSEVRNYYVSEDLWVPVCSIKNQLYILPGIPELFEGMLQGLIPILKENFALEKRDGSSFRRYFVKTTKTESAMAGYLRAIQLEATDTSNDIKIGSYPHYGLGFNTVSISGTELHDVYLQKLASRVAIDLEGEQVSEEQERTYTETREA